MDIRVEFVHVKLVYLAAVSGPGHDFLAKVVELSVPAVVLRSFIDDPWTNDEHVDIAVQIAVSTGARPEQYGGNRFDWPGPELGLEPVDQRFGDAGQSFHRWPGDVVAIGDVQQCLSGSGDKDETLSRKPVEGLSRARFAAGAGEQMQ
jgi:hypothetical protein